MRPRKRRQRSSPRWLSIGLLTFLASLQGSDAAFAALNCTALAKLALPMTSISRAESASSGIFSPPSGNPISDLPVFCRVSGIIKPSADSNIQFEVWLPESGWNGKFKAVGNGGFAGEINYWEMGRAVARGYVTASTDTGHQGGSIDAGWALGHPEKIIDFGYRAIHMTTMNAKAIVRAFYGQGPKHSYFSSCSNGGRQALMEAQRYPEDYDGIVAGAPAYDWTHLLATSVWNMQTLLGKQESYIPANKLPFIQSAALAACDALDGLKDGTIDNPSHCRLDPSVLQCQGTQTTNCLTIPQVAVLKKLYAGRRVPGNAQLFPGYAPGGEAGQGRLSRDGG